MTMLNNLFLLINKVSKTKDQSGPFVFLSLLVTLFCWAVLTV